MSRIIEIIVGIVASILSFTILKPGWNDQLDTSCGWSWRVVLVLLVVSVAILTIVSIQCVKAKSKTKCLEKEITTKKLNSDDLLQREAVVKAKENEWSTLMRTVDLGEIVSILAEKKDLIYFYADQRLAVDSINGTKIEAINAVPNGSTAVINFEMPRNLEPLPQGIRLSVIQQNNVVANAVITQNIMVDRMAQCVVIEDINSREWIASIRASYLFRPVRLEEIFLVPELHPDLEEYKWNQIIAIGEAFDNAISALRPVVENQNDTRESNSNTE